MTTTPASGTEQALHWTLAATVTSLVLTGAVMYVPALSQFIGQRFWVRTIHLAGAAGVVLVPAIFAVLRWPEMRSLEVQLSRWGPAAMEWFVRPWRVFCDGDVTPRERPERFNGGQKLFALLLAVALSALLVTGIPMYWWSRFGAEVVARSRDLHVVAALALMGLLGGHVYLGLLSPYGLIQTWRLNRAPSRAAAGHLRRRWNRLRGGRSS